MNRLISVIVAIFNVEHVLERTLSCISNQTYRNLEIILVDDGSTDSSGLICDAFAEKDPRCKVIHKQNGGQGSAKNAGQAVANGKDTVTLQHLSRGIYIIQGRSGSNVDTIKVTINS